MIFSHFIDSVFVLVCIAFYKSIMECKNTTLLGLRIHQDDALALERIGFYEELAENEYELDRDTAKKFIVAIKRKLVLTDAGWEFIQTVFEVGNGPEDKFNRYMFEVDLSQKYI